MRRRQLHLMALAAAMGLAASDAVVLDAARVPLTRSEIETNNTAAVATPLRLTSGYGIAAGAIGSPGDVDYWSFPAAALTHVSVLCDTGGEQAAGATSRRVTVDVIGTQGEVLESDSGDGTGTGGDRTIETSDAAAIALHLVPQAGTYYIRVAGERAEDVITPYSLVVSLTLPPRLTEVEPNNHYSAAMSIARTRLWGAVVGAIDAPGDRDAFSFTAWGGEQLFFVLSTSGSDLVVDLHRNYLATWLITVDGSTAGSPSNPVAESASVRLPGPDTYALTVRHATGAGTGSYSLMVVVAPSSDAAGDFDGDFRTDWAVQSLQGLWTIVGSTGWGTAVSLGLPSAGDVPVPGDYDGDGLADVATYRTTTGEWLISGVNGVTTVQWGEPAAHDVPVPGDYDGDRRHDIAVYRRTTGDWFVRFSSGGSRIVRWGAPWLDDIPVQADYEGDGKTDFAVFRHATGQWFVGYSSGSLRIIEWGAPWLGDVPVPGDYDGDGHADFVVYRRSTGGWFIRHAGLEMSWYSWGAAASGDLPVPGDYDGDGAADIVIYRPETGTFYVRASYSGGALMTPGPGPDHLPVTLPIAVRLLFMP